MNFSNVYFGRYFVHNHITLDSHKFTQGGSFKPPYFATLRFKECGIPEDVGQILGFIVSPTSFTSDFGNLSTSAFTVAKKISFSYRANRISLPFVFRFSVCTTYYDFSWRLLLHYANFGTYPYVIARCAKLYFVFLFLIKVRLHLILQKRYSNWSSLS